MVVDGDGSGVGARRGWWRLSEAEAEASWFNKKKYQRIESKKPQHKTSTQRTAANKKCRKLITVSLKGSLFA